MHKHMIEELGTAGRPCRPVAVLPLPPRRHRRVLRPGQRRPQAGCPAWRSPRPRHSASISPRRGSSATAPATSGWRARSAPTPLHVGPVGLPGRRRPLLPRPARRRPPHPRRRRRDDAEAEAVVPGSPLSRRRHVRLAHYARELQPRPGLGRGGPRSPRPPICSTEPTTGTSTVFACGNGGSASIANHLQCDHVKGVRNGTDLNTRVVQPEHERRAVQRDRERPSATTRSSSTSCSRSPGPVTCSSPSRRRAGRRTSCAPWSGRPATACTTIALTGFSGGAARELADVSIHVDVRQLRSRRGRAPGRACTCWPSTSGSRG